jgi:thiamine-phosphate pyrophosphorylase
MEIREKRELREKRENLWKKMDLYPVITPHLCGGRDPVYVLEQLIEGGIKGVQLRTKNTTDAELFNLAKKFRELTSENNVLLIINDRLDIALAVDADGIHLGQDDLPVSIARKLAPDLIIGGSSHNLKEALELEKAGASYVNIGPIYKTQTKTLAIPPLGEEAIKTISPSLNIPFTIMGGIKSNHIPNLVSLGAKTIAMVTQLTQAEDIKSTTIQLINSINNS